MALFGKNEPSVKREDVLGALKAVIDPDFNKDIVSLGFVKNVEIRGGDVSLDIELTTPACPVRERFKAEAETILSAIKGIGKVQINMTSLPRRPQTQEVVKSGLEKVRTIIAISSCKGGVGKSTVAALIAKELCQRSVKVGLLDVDIYGPSTPTLFNAFNVVIELTPEKKMKPVVVDRLPLMSFGFLLKNLPAVLRGPIVSNYLQQIVHHTDWGELDYLVIDLPPGTGDIQLTLSQTVPLDGAVIVTTSQALSLADVEKGILMFEKVNVPILGIIENMAWFECDSCHKKHPLFGVGAAEKLRQRFGVEALAELPILPEFGRTFEKQFHHPLIKEATDQVIRAIGKSTKRKESLPTVKSEDGTLLLTWPDGTIKKILYFDLRASCRCAECINEVTGEVLLKKEAIRKDIQPTSIQPIGNYALHITWNDGHTSGIYSYENIKQL